VVRDVVSDGSSMAIMTSGSTRRKSMSGTPGRVSIGSSRLYERSERGECSWTPISNQLHFTNFPCTLQKSNCGV
jgi:hypothetical protein